VGQFGGPVLYRVPEDAGEPVYGVGPVYIGAGVNEL
jgi:hypothetical protein